MAATILIADDYEDNLELLRLLLVAAHYRVIEARNGAECLKLAKQFRPDLVMVDLSMPVVDGWDMLRALRADKLTASIPCIAVTAHGDTDRDLLFGPDSMLMYQSPSAGRSGGNGRQTVIRPTRATYAAESPPIET